MKSKVAHSNTFFLFTFLTVLLSLTACGEQADVSETDAPASARTPVKSVAAVGASRIIDANAEPGNWLAHGRTYDEQRFSPLADINDSNVDRLGLSWFYDFPTKRGMEATPLAIDGVLYVSGSWSMVYAFDALSGELLWQYNPEVTRAKALHACCDVVKTGVSLHGRGRFTSAPLTAGWWHWMLPMAALSGMYKPPRKTQPIPSPAPPGLSKAM